MEGPRRYFKELDERIKVSILGTGVHNWSSNISSQYNQLYAVSLGADYVQVGLLNSIGAVITSLISVPLGWATEKYGVKKVMLFGLVCSVLSALIYVLAGGWLLLVPALILASITGRIMNPLTDIIFINCTKGNQRGALMGLSRVIWGLLNVSAPIIAAYIVGTSGGINSEGIRPLYFIQVIMGIVMFAYFALRLEPLTASIEETGRESKEEGFIESFREFFKGEKWLKRWIVLRVVRQFGAGIATPFVYLWMVNEKGADPYILGVMGAASVITSCLLQIPAGRLADRIGRKNVFFLLRPFSFLGVLLLILAPRPWYLVLVGILGAVGVTGGVGSVSFTSFITMHWELVPAEKRGRWFGVEGVMNIVTVPATIIGGLLWQQGYLRTVFIIPVLLEALVVIPLLYTIPDTLKQAE